MPHLKMGNPESGKVVTLHVQAILAQKHTAYLQHAGNVVHLMPCKIRCDGESRFHPVIVMSPVQLWE